MEFWGVEVKPGEPLKVKPEVFRLIHISQAALGEIKDGKGPKCVPIHLKVGDKKYVIGTLSAEDRPQLMFDLVFEREFELSHDWKDGSIYFAGYIADDDSSELESHSDGEDFSNEDEEEENQVDELQNAKLEPNVGPKSATNKALPAEPKPLEKSIFKKVELKKDKTESNEDDDEGEEISEMEEDSSDASADRDSEDSDDENQDMVSQKTKSGKKRPPETATEMLVPVAAKKTKSAAPQISGGKSPSANGKSGSQVSGKSCSKTFNSKNALQSRAKAKHGGK
nr:histone deacetylase HDT1-like [Coffea arabica]